MSFSQEVKTELIDVRLRRPEDGAKLVDGATFAAASLKYSREHRTWGLHYVSESSAVINFISKLAVRAYDLEQEISLNVHERLNARNTELFLYGKDTDKLCVEAGLVSYDENGDKSFETHIPDGLSTDHACRAFIRGVFLICGSVSDPNTACHAELVFKNESVALKICGLLNERGIAAKSSRRRNQWLVYMKNGDTVEDFLTFMGAGESKLAVMNGRMLREVANNSNREVNCIFANMEKAAKASAQQVEDIKLIISVEGADRLSDDLYELAEARMANPELTLTELADTLGIGRSAANYRLKKLHSIAEDIRSALDKHMPNGEDQ